MHFIGPTLKNFSAIEKSKIFFDPTNKTIRPMISDAFGPKPPSNDRAMEDDFAHFARELQKRHGGSLHKRAKLTVGEATVTNVNAGTSHATPAHIASIAVAGGAVGSLGNGLTMGRIEIGGTGAGGHAPSLTGFLPTERPAGVIQSTQVGGNHYGDQRTDVFAFSLANKLDPLQFSVVKYVTRFRAKDGLKDLLKARDCLDRLIKTNYPDHK